MGQQFVGAKVGGKHPPLNDARFTQTWLDENSARNRSADLQRRGVNHTSDAPTNLSALRQSWAGQLEQIVAVWHSDRDRGAATAREHNRRNIISRDGFHEQENSGRTPLAASCQQRR